MVEKTRGIILHQIKYTDSGIISQIYTRKFGRLSFLIRGIRNRKAGKHNIIFQPMFILDMEIQHKNSREIQVLKEFNIAFTPYNIYSDIRKSSVAIFLGEILTSVLREESPHEDLFDFIEDSINYFENSSEGFANFHIAFLSGLSSYLGFEPSPRIVKTDRFFDMTDGSFVSLRPTHTNYANEEISEILAEFFSSSYKSSGKIILNGKLRNEVLDIIVRYYSLHLPGLKRLKSLEILKEVFS